ncbi:MAG: hypothetical protein H0V31_10345 [Acidobacteria bacterium]|nr:hypothetical protein [Acidobacteriota bacterium]
MTNKYPYYFIDVNQLGYSAVLFNAVIMSVGFFGLGEIFVGIDKLMSQTLVQNAN